MFFFLYWYFYWPSSWFNCLCLFILLSQIWFSCSGIGRQVVSMCSASYWDLSEHAHTYTQKRNNLWNGPQHFSSTPFLGDSWGLFFFFFSWYILWPRGWTFAKGERVLLGDLFLVLISCQTKSPLVHYDRTWIKMLFSCILSCLFGHDLLLQFASFNTASGIISESYSFLTCQAG